MVYYLIMCRSLTYAQRISRVLEKARINTVIMRPPLELGTEGCSYCVKIPEKWLSAALSVIERNGLGGGKIYTLNTDEGSLK